MQLFTIQIIVSLLVLQSCVNHENGESKISTTDSFNRIENELSSARETILDTLAPPLPPPPPIPKGEVVKAKKLAADYAANKSLADKKYKKVDNILFVEGIVKEIKESKDDGLIIIILDGTPAPIDVRCETINTKSARKLNKGMKATFIGHNVECNGNVVLSKCFHIENPTYE